MPNDSFVKTFPWSERKESLFFFFFPPFNRFDSSYQEWTPTFRILPGCISIESIVYLDFFFFPVTETQPNPAQLQLEPRSSRLSSVVLLSISDNELDMSKQGVQERTNFHTWGFLVL